MEAAITSSPSNYSHKLSTCVAVPPNSTSSLLWVPTSPNLPDNMFQPAICLSEEGDGHFRTELSDGTKTILTFLKSQVHKRNPHKYEQMADMVFLKYVNEASLLYNIKERFACGNIYVSLIDSAKHLLRMFTFRRS